MKAKNKLMDLISGSPKTDKQLINICFDDDQFLRMKAKAGDTPIIVFRDFRKENMSRLKKQKMKSPVNNRKKLTKTG